MLATYKCLFILFVFKTYTALGCYTKEDKYVKARSELVPDSHPSRMLGWEQMVLMFPNYPKIKVFSSRTLYFLLPVYEYFGFDCISIGIITKLNFCRMEMDILWQLE